MPDENTPEQDLDPKSLAKKISSGDRSALARSITLVESKLPEHRQKARLLIQELLPLTGKARRIGITGVPGAGKSTLIDQFGTNLVEEGYKVAVLSIDPSSNLTGGSILGDKTRMSRLAANPDAFIRPSPSSGTLGGVGANTRETMLLCEAAGFDVILIETVGIGQSETTVEDMVDFFLVLVLAGAGDELQGIKKGILEVADLIAVNKADGEGKQRAESAASEYRMAFNILAPKSELWTPPVMTISGLHNEDLDSLWEKIEAHRNVMLESGNFQSKRSEQQVSWMWSMLKDQIMENLKHHPGLKKQLPLLEEKVRGGELEASVAVDQILSLWEKS